MEDHLRRYIKSGQTPPNEATSNRMSLNAMARKSDTKEIESKHKVVQENKFLKMLTSVEKRIGVHRMKVSLTTADDDES